MSSPTSTATLAHRGADDDAGESAGTYVIDGCGEDGACFSGFFAGSGTTAGDTLPLEAMFTQSQTSVGGTATLTGASLSGGFRLD